MGADVLVIYLAFRINYRSGHLVERLHLTRDSLTVRRIWPGGRSRTWEFQPYWLQVVFDEQAVGNERADCPLILRSHGKSLAVGSFLTRQERGEVATALRAALGRAQQPCRPASGLTPPDPAPRAWSRLRAACRRPHAPPSPPPGPT